MLQSGLVAGQDLDTSMLLDLAQTWHQGSPQVTKLSGTFELSSGLSDNISFTTIGRGQFIGPDKLEPGNSRQSSVSPATKRIYLNPSAEIELRELYLDFDFEKASLRLGKQQVVWGQADGLKLLDLINPQDFREFILDDFNHSRIPLWMFNLALYFDIGDLQVLWIPDTTMHSLPEKGALFEITAPFQTLPQGTPIEFKEIDRPDNLFKDSDVGLRLSKFIAGWDLTLHYLYHFDDFPVMRSSLTEKGIRFSPAYERTHTVGASASNAFGDIIFRSEVVLNSDKYFNTGLSTINPAVNDGVSRSREFGYVFGFDWTGLRDTFISFQMFQSRMLDDKDALRRKIETSFTLLLRRNFLNESIQLETLWIFNQEDKDNLLRLKGRFETSSNTSITLFVDIFNGESDELFGQFDSRDQVGIKLSYGL
ncbi:MAG: hypothetical protein ACI9CE_000206 [Flavobacterium sp.]|jgi:hypothetical protein